MTSVHGYLHGELPVYDIEFRMRHRDEHYIWIQSRGVVLRHPDGHPYRMAGSHTDITERKTNEEILCKARIDAEAASEAKNQFLATVSHELRTPMNSIINFTNLTLGGELLPEQREHLTLLKSSADSLMVIINDVLDFSKIEAGKLDIHPRTFSVKDLLSDTVKALALEAHA
jgi:signal transduction histidine kinase